MFTDESRKIVTELDVTNWDISNITDLSTIFMNYTNVKRIIGLNAWNTSHVTRMSSMFANCRCLEEVDLTSFDTSNVQTFAYMFCGCNSLKRVYGLEKLNVSNVQTMYLMFYGCSSLVYVQKCNWNTQNLVNISHMFGYCSNLAICNCFENSDMSLVHIMDGLFCYCNKLQHVGGISKWNVLNVTDMSGMFEDCITLRSIDLSNWNPLHLVSSHEMLYRCHNLRVINLNGWYTQNGNEFVKDLKAMNVDIITNIVAYQIFSQI